MKKQGIDPDLALAAGDVLVLPDSGAHLAMQYIREHAAHPIRVSDLLEAANISRRKLEHEFLRVYGQTPHQAIVQAHLARARQLLLETDWPVAQIAKQSGFGGKRHFHHAVAALEVNRTAEIGTDQPRTDDVHPSGLLVVLADLLAHRARRLAFAVRDRLEPERQRRRRVQVSDYAIQNTVRGLRNPRTPGTTRRDCEQPWRLTSLFSPYPGL